MESLRLAAPNNSPEFTGSIRDTISVNVNAVARNAPDFLPSSPVNEALGKCYQNV